MRLVFVSLLVAAAPLATVAQTAGQGFSTGPVIEDFGPAAPVEQDMAIPDGLDLKVVFDIAAPAEEGEINKGFVTVARFLNMHGKAGVDMSRVHPAIVVHGGASSQLVISSENTPNATQPLIEALLDQGVPVYLCGQTAAARGIAKEDLIPGVELALSAMTAHAVLAADGYSLNPF
ncbi:MAG: DsrE family protein [Henriciella sp.]|uniref:DsrE family protein n=1 Tax=Henriciella sp. TaxID=1968823 RepID=UPI003C77CE37